MTGTPRFWRMSADANTGDTWVEPDSDPRACVEGAAVDLLAAGETLDEPFPLTVFNRGKRQGDLLHAGGAFVMVASDRFISVLEDIDASGWVSSPAHIRYGNGEELPGYQLLVPTGRCANFYADVDEDDEDENDVSRGVDPSIGWDGADVFWFEARAMSLMVTDRVKQAIETARLERVEFEDPTVDHYFFA